MNRAFVIVAFWIVVVVAAALVFVASNFAGPAGTPIIFKPTLYVIGVASIVFAAGLLVFYRHKEA